MRSGLVVVTFAFLAACGDNHKVGDDGEPTSNPNHREAVEMVCATLPATATTCEVTAGAAENKTMLLKGNVLTSTTIFKGGQVAVDAAGQISCVGCNCATGGETTISCPDAVISPGLINTHDHITYTHNDPYLPTGDHATERYDNRQQWREGNDGHYKIPYKSSASNEQIRWGELRFVMGGATSIVGSGSQPGLLRNLDELLDDQGLGHKNVDFDTFPLGDANGKQQTDSCDYGTATTEASIAGVDAYEPHTSEGIDAFARNEFLCESSATYDTTTPGVSHNLLLSKTAMIHAIGLLAEDYRAMADAGTGLIWSPRSNLTLYGDTARVSVADRFGVEIALGTDWMPSGSMNLLRELACADSFNATYLDHHFTDQQLWEMVTVNAASVTATDDAIGTLAVGKQADIAIFASHGRAAFRSVISAEPKDVALVMRGGKVLYGDDVMVNALAQTCDTVDVCGVGKRVCTMSEVARTYDMLKSAANIYPAFTCGVPENEPSCVPTRPTAVAQSTVYTGAVSTGDSDGDGIDDDDDNCPRVFNPIRPLDNGEQGDADGDGAGDACDACPLDADTSKCEIANYIDRDGDGLPNVADNCPADANENQADGDRDGKGDMCDQCPADANPGFAGCPSTIYMVKNGVSPIGRSVRITNGLVTGRASNGFFIQVKQGDAGYIGPDYSGLFVFTRSAPPTKAVVGSRVTVDGAITLFAGEIELDTVLNIAVTSTEVEAPPAPVAVSVAEVRTGQPRAASLEGVLVTIGASHVSAIDTMFPVEFTVDDAGNALVIDDLLFKLAVPRLGRAIGSVTGVLAFRNNAAKLEPRSAADLVLGPPGVLSITPALAFARVGVTTDALTFPTPLTVTLEAPAQGDTTLVFSSDATKLTVANAVVPSGSTTAQIHVTAVAASTTPVAISTTLEGLTATASVRVLDVAEAPTTVRLPPAVVVATNGVVTITATLDVPALAVTPIALVLDPPTAGTLVPSVDIAVGALSATFTYTDTSGAAATITATFGGSTSSAAITVSATQGHLMISRIYGAGGNAGASLKNDFIELHNPGPTDVSLNGMSLQYNSATGANPWNVAALPDKVIPAGGYFLVAQNGGANGVDLPTPDATGGLSMAAANGKVALVSNVTPLLAATCRDAVVVDVIGYGTSNCFETAAVGALSTTTSASRKAAGCTDTDNNLADFTVSTIDVANDPPRNSATTKLVCP